MLQTIFQPFPELTTSRLLLRQVHLADATEFFFLRSSPQVLKYVPREPAKSLDDAKTFIKSITQSVKKNEAIFWGIVLRNNPGTIIGSIGLWQFQRENLRAEIGYVLHPDYWGQGMAKEALQKAMEYAFAKIKLHSVEARIDPENKASAAVLLANGFVKEAYFKEDTCFRGKFLDSEVYSRLA